MCVETETLKVLELVKSGKLSPGDGAKLLEELNRQQRQPDRGEDYMRNVRC